MLRTAGLLGLGLSTLAFALGGCSKKGETTPGAAPSASASAFKPAAAVASGLPGALDQVSGDTASGYRFYQIRNVQGPNRLCLAPFNNTESQGQLMHYYTCTTPPAIPVGDPQVFAFTR